MLKTVALFLDSKAAETGAAQNTLEAYARDLKDFVTWCSAKSSSFETIQKSEIEDYLIDLDAQGLAQSTRQRRLSAIKQFFQFYCEEGLRADNPTLLIKGASSKRKLPHSFSVDEVDALLHVAQTAGKNVYERARDTCLIQILYATGMRITEMMSLPASAVRGTPDMILIRGKGSKERLVPLSPDAKTAIETWLFHRDKKEDERMSKGMTGSKFLFPSSGKLGHLTRHWFFQKIKQWAREAGLNAELISPHAIRHAFATHLLANGADLRIIQTLLGHADVATTEIYTHVVDEKLHVLVQDHHPLAASPSAKKQSLD